jgi:hypothetical protein
MKEIIKKGIEEAKEEVRKGKVHSWEDIKKELQLNV